MNIEKEIKSLEKQRAVLEDKIRFLREYSQIGKKSLKGKEKPVFSEDSGIDTP